MTSTGEAAAHPGEVGRFGLLGCGAATVILWAPRTERTTDRAAGLVVAGRLSLLALVVFDGRPRPGRARRPRDGLTTGSLRRVRVGSASESG